MIGQAYKDGSFSFINTQFKFTVHKMYMKGIVI